MSSRVSVLTNETLSGGLATQAGRDGDLGMILMDLSLRPIASDRGAAAILNDLETSSMQYAPGFSIPPEVEKAMRESKPGDLGNFRWRIRRGRREYKCRAFLLKPHDGSLPRELVVLHLEGDWSPADSLSELSTEYRLTSREQEVLRGIAMGLTGKELADRMNIRPSTVKSFIRMIMIKLGARTRGAILAKLLEYNGNNLSYAPWRVRV